MVLHGLAVNHDLAFENLRLYGWPMGLSGAFCASRAQSIFLDFDIVAYFQMACAKELSHGEESGAQKTTGHEHRVVMDVAKVPHKLYFHSFNVLSAFVLVDKMTCLNQSSTVKPLAGLGSVACTFA